MTEESEKVVISPYVFAGIKPIDLPKSFYNTIKLNVVEYKVEHVIKGIDRYLKISEKQLKSRCRKRTICDARHMYCHFLKDKMKYSLVDIGETYERDHTTVISSIGKHNNLYQSDQKYKALYDRISRYVEIMSASDEDK